MDKNSFSSYGWLVSVVLIIAIMIGFATPFAGRIKDGATELLNGFGDIANNALGNTGNNNSGGGNSGGNQGGGSGDVVTPPDNTPRLEGGGQTYYTLAPTSLTFTSNVTLESVQEVRINETTVDSSSYTLVGDKLIFPISYLKNLVDDFYEVTVVTDTASLNSHFTVVSPKLNEHSFYYNQPYVGHVEYYGEDWVFFLRENGTMDFMILNSNYSEVCTYEIDGGNITVSATGGTFTGTVSEEGVYCNELATMFTLGHESIVADGDYLYVLNDSGDAYYVSSVINKTKSSYGTIRTGINNKPTTQINNYAFADCTNLISITIPECIEYVLDYAFSGCVSLEKVVFENCEVLLWGGSIFEGAPMTQGKIMEHSDEDNNNICDRCNHCEHLNTELQNATEDYYGDTVCIDCGRVVTKGYYTAGLLDSRGNLVASWDELVTTYGMDISKTYTYSTAETDIASPYYILTNTPELANGVKLMIGDSVTFIGDYAFRNCRSLTSITIPNSVTSIGNCAFANCNSLVNITIPDSVTNIGNHAFDYCTSLSNITIPDSVTSINDYAFADCRSLVNITIPDSVKSIGTYAFLRCESLTSVTISNSVTNIGSSAFYDCESLTNFTFEGTIAQWNAITFDSHWNDNVPATYVQCTDGQVPLK